MTPPDDANDLRGTHFRQLLGNPWMLLLIGGLAIAAGAFGASEAGPRTGGLALVGVVLVGLGILFWIADRRAADDFFEVYAQQRGLTLVHGRGQLPPRTPLLRKGDDRYTERTLVGPLGDGFDGTLALYTYEEEHTDSDGGRQTDTYHYTVGLVEVPECARFVPELYCQRKFGLRALEGLEDVFRRSKERVTLESEALLDRYEIFAGKQQDPTWLRRLFAPTFIVWLTDSAPDKFAFELVDGTLCCYVKGHRENAAELDGIAAASAAVAARLREESAQTALGGSGT
jgi:hypothetical protein